MVTIVVAVILVLGVYEVASLYAPARTQEVSGMSAVAHPLRSFRGWRKRSKVAALVVVALLALGGAALAYYLTQLSGSGTGTGTLGGAPTSLSIPLDVNVPDGLTPANSETITISTDPSTAVPGGSYSIPSISIGNITTNTPGCNPNWFSVDSIVGLDSSGNPQSLPHTASANDLNGGQPIGQARLRFTESGADQSACEGATITIPASIP